MIRGEIIWVTGASSGIGQELARQLASAGNSVIASARNPVPLERMAQTFPNIQPLIFDVADDMSIATTREKLNAITDHLDRVILNAGTCEYLDIHAPDWSLIGKMCAVNCAGMANTLAASLELLKNAKSPHVIGVSSQVVNAPFPRAEAYGASKAAATYLLDSLRMDLKQFNVDVSILFPGFVDTPLTRRNDFPMPFLMSADVAAARMIRHIEKRPFHYAFPRRLGVVLWFARSMPSLWLRLNTGSRSKT